MKKFWKIVTVFFAIMGIVGKVLAISSAAPTHGDKKEVLMWVYAGAVGKGMAYSARERGLTDKGVVIAAYPTSRAFAFDGELHGIKGQFPWGAAVGVTNAEAWDQNFPAWKVIKKVTNGDADMALLQKKGVVMTTYLTWGAVASDGERQGVKAQFMWEPRVEVVTADVWGQNIPERNLVKKVANGDADMGFRLYAQGAVARVQKEQCVLMTSCPTWSAIASSGKMNVVMAEFPRVSGTEVVTGDIWDQNIPERNLVKKVVDGDAGIAFVSYLGDGRPSGPMGIDDKQMWSSIGNSGHLGGAMH